MFQTTNQMWFEDPNFSVQRQNSLTGFRMFRFVSDFAVSGCVRLIQVAHCAAQWMNV
jgi:hypothetical protein